MEEMDVLPQVTKQDVGGNDYASIGIHKKLDEENKRIFTNDLAIKIFLSAKTEVKRRRRRRRRTSEHY